VGQILGKRSLRSRKGLSTAVGTAFYIIVVMISLSSMWAIGAFQARYQAVTDKMNVWDTERISENLNIRSVNNTIQQIGQLKYNFSMTVDNNGGVAVNIARIYFLDQTNNKLNISDPINGSAPKPRRGFNYSTINTGEVSHVIAVNVTTQLSLALKASHPCRIILTTDRGRQFSYNYPPPMVPPAPAVAFSYGSMQINYVDHNNEAYWVDPLISSTNLDHHACDDKDLYFRAKFINILDHDLTIRRGSVLFQICVGPANKKILGFGGYIHESDTTWSPGEEVTVVFLVDSVTWINVGELNAIFTPSITETTFTGTAAFSSGTPQGGEDFFSAAILMDGLLVYKPT